MNFVSTDLTETDVVSCASVKPAGVHPLSVCLLALLALPVIVGCAPVTPRPERSSFDPDSVPDAFARPSAFLAWPGATRGYLIGPAGDLDDGDATLSLEPSADDVPAAAPKRVAFEQRWLPVAHWRRSSGPVRFDFEAVALPHAAPRDTALWASVTVTATNTGSRRARAALDMALARPAKRNLFVAFDRAAADSAPSFSRGGTQAVRAWCGTGAGGPRSRWRAILEPGASSAVRIVCSTYTLPAHEFAAWAAAPHASRVAQARRYWESEIARGARFELSDPETENALRAAWIVLLSCRERRGADWVPIGGPFHYRDVWLRDGARAVNALAVGGFGVESVQLARGLSRLQWDDGALISQRGQLDGLGQGPWGYAQAVLRRAPDSSGVALLAQSAFRVWRYRQALRSFAAGLASPYASMLPVAEPRDCELTRAQFVGNDAWARRPDVPPSWQSRGLDWGNLAVGWPCRVLAPDDPHLAELARRVWASAGGSGRGEAVRAIALGPARRCGGSVRGASRGRNAARWARRRRLKLKRSGSPRPLACFVTILCG